MFQYCKFIRMFFMQMWAGLKNVQAKISPIWLKAQAKMQVSWGQKFPKTHFRRKRKRTRKKWKRKKHSSFSLRFLILPILWRWYWLVFSTIAAWGSFKVLYSTQEVELNTRLRLAFFPLYFTRALDQRLLACFTTEQSTVKTSLLVNLLSLLTTFGINEPLVLMLTLLAFHHKS